jgi:DNA repair protein RecO (recombination protein O)
MLEKTRGIILHQIKYTDSGIVAQMYTRKFGRQSFLIKGMRNRKTGKHNILFQPMFILDLELYYKASREMQTLKEFSVSFTPYDIYSNIKKSCVAIFLGEVLTSVLKEESPHEEMFDILKSQLFTLTNAKKVMQIFILHFWQD